MGFPGGSDRRQRICLQCRRPRFDPWVGEIPWRREWLPTPGFLPEEFHGQKSLVSYNPWRIFYMCVYMLFEKNTPKSVITMSVTQTCSSCSEHLASLSLSPRPSSPKT